MCVCKRRQTGTETGLDRRWKTSGTSSSEVDRFLQGRSTLAVHVHVQLIQQASPRDSGHSHHTARTPARTPAQTPCRHEGRYHPPAGSVAARLCVEGERRLVREVHLGLQVARDGALPGDHLPVSGATTHQVVVIASMKRCCLLQFKQYSRFGRVCRRGGPRGPGRRRRKRIAACACPRS